MRIAGLVTPPAYMTARVHGRSDASPTKFVLCEDADMGVQLRFVFHHLDALGRYAGPEQVLDNAVLGLADVLLIAEVLRVDIDLIRVVGLATQVLKLHFD